MEREEAIKILEAHTGQNLYELAERYGITVKSQKGKVNKGWAGHVCERILGLQLNSAQSPNFGSWELKCIPVHWSVKYEKWLPKETMAITMIDPEYVIATSFDNSHLKAKLAKAVIVARTVGESYDRPSFIHKIIAFDLAINKEIEEVIRSDYEHIRAVLSRSGTECLTSKMGTYIQPRTKGSGHGSTSRAFYAKTTFLKLFLE